MYSKIPRRSIMISRRISKKEWDEDESRYQLMMMVLHAQNEEHLTPSELAERTGLRQSNISCH